MAGNYTRRINLYINGRQVTNDIKSISSEFNKLNAKVRQMTIGSREYNRAMSQLRYLRGIIDQHNAALRTTNINLTSLKGLANAFNKYWPVVMGTVGAIAGLVFSTKRATDTFTEFDDKIADVMKVTDMAREEVLEMNKELLKMDTRTAQNDMLDLLYVAGKLGVRGKEDLLGFVSAADKISVALAKELGGNAEAAVRAIGKAVEIFDLDKVYGIEDAMLRVGSAVNLLGMSSTAQEGFLVSFLERVAGIAPMAGVGVDKILGLAAALDRYGQKSEVSATAYSKLMSKMATETEAMAKIMGMSMEDYVKAFTEDANETMLKLFESLKGEGTTSFTTLVQLLGESDLEGQRMTQVMGTMVNKVDEIRNQMNLATQAMKDNVSIQNEFNIKNNTAAASVEKKEKKIKALRVEMGEKLLPVYSQGLSLTMEFIKTLTVVIQFIYKYRSTIAGLVTLLVVYRTVSATLLAIEKMKIMTTGLLRWTILRLQVAYYALTGATYKAAKAMVMLKAVSITSPWIMLISAIAAVVAAISAFSYKVGDAIEKVLSLNERFNEIQKEKAEAINQEKTETNLLVKQINSMNEESALRNTLVAELIEKYPQLLAGLDNEKLKLQSINQILESINRGYETKLKIAAIESQVEARQQQIVKNNVRLMEIEQSMEAMRTDERIEYDASKMKLWEVEYNSLSDANKKYLNEIENFVKKAKSIREKALTDEIAQQEQILKNLSGVYGLVKDSYDSAVAKNDQAEIDKLKGTVDRLFDRIEVTKQIIANLKAEAGIINPDLIKDGGKGGKKDGPDYSEDAEIKARIAAKEKYKKGIIKSEIDLETELDKISLRFMRGRLSQMDKDAEDRAELQEKIVDKELEMAKKEKELLNKIYQSGIQFSPIQQAQSDFHKALKDLNLPDKTSAMSTDQLLAYQAEREKYQRTLNTIDANAIKERVQLEQSGFEDALSKLKVAHINELANVKTYEDAMLILRQHYTEEELKKIDDLNEAKLKLQEYHNQVEDQMTAEHLNGLLAQIQSFMEDGSWQGLNLADAIMSEEEWEALKTILNDLIQKLEKAKKEKQEMTGGEDSDKEKDLKLPKKLQADILGFTVEDWQIFFDNLEKGKLGIEDLAMAAYGLANGWKLMAQGIKNAEDQALQDMQSRVDYKTKELQRQLDQGIISQETYNKKVGKLEAQMEDKRAEYAYNQAVRERNIALFEAAINTASAIIEAAPSVPLMIMAAAVGALQMGVIASTPLPSMTGKEEGGFFDVLRDQDKKKFRARYNPSQRGWISRPTILAGEGKNREYVVPDEAMENPTIRPIISMFEMARLSKNLKTINMNKALPALSGRSTGGYFKAPSLNTASHSSSKSHSDASSDMQLLSEINATLKGVNRLLNQPLNAVIKYQDITDITERVEEIEELTSL